MYHNLRRSLLQKYQKQNSNTSGPQFNPPQSRLPVSLPQLLDRVRHREASKQPIISMSSTLRIVIDLRLMRVPSLGLRQLVIPTGGRTLITITTLQKTQTAVRIASRLWHVARGSSRSGAPLCRGRWWIRRANGSVRGRRAWLCKALVCCRVLVLASSAPIDLGSRGCNREWPPSLRYPSRIVPGPWRRVRVIHTGCRRCEGNFVKWDTAGAALVPLSVLPSRVWSFQLASHLINLNSYERDVCRLRY